ACVAISRDSCFATPLACFAAVRELSNPRWSEFIPSCWNPTARLSICCCCWLSLLNRLIAGPAPLVPRSRSLGLPRPSELKRLMSHLRLALKLRVRLGHPGFRRLEPSNQPAQQLRMRHDPDCEREVDELPPAASGQEIVPVRFGHVSSLKARGFLVEDAPLLIDRRSRVDLSRRRLVQFASERTCRHTSASNRKPRRPSSCDSRSAASRGDAGFERVRLEGLPLACRHTAATDEEERVLHQCGGW